MIPNSSTTPLIPHFSPLSRKWCRNLISVGLSFRDKWTCSPIGAQKWNFPAKRKLWTRPTNQLTIQQTRRLHGEVAFSIRHMTKEKLSPASRVFRHHTRWISRISSRSTLTFWSLDHHPESSFVCGCDWLTIKQERFLERCLRIFTYYILKHLCTGC